MEKGRSKAFNKAGDEKDILYNLKIFSKMKIDNIP